MNTLFNLTQFAEQPIATGSQPGMQVLYLVLGALVTLMIFFVIITWFGFIPIRRMVQTRTELVQKEIDDAFASNEIAEKNKNKSADKLGKAVIEYERTISSAKVEATSSKKEIITKAKDEAKSILVKAKKLGTEVQAEMKQQAMEDISDIAILAASKIIEKQIDEKTNKKLIDDLLRKIK